MRHQLNCFLFRLLDLLLSDKHAVIELLDRWAVVRLDLAQALDEEGDGVYPREEQEEMAHPLVVDLQLLMRNSSNECHRVHLTRECEYEGKAAHCETILSL